MKRAIFLAITYALLSGVALSACVLRLRRSTAGFARSGRQKSPGRRKSWPDRRICEPAIDPDSLEEFRTAVVATIDEGVKRVGEAKLLESFPGVKTVKALKALECLSCLPASFVERPPTRA